MTAGLGHSSGKGQGGERAAKVFSGPYIPLAHSIAIPFLLGSFLSIVAFIAHRECDHKMITVVAVLLTIT